MTLIGDRFEKPFIAPDATNVVRRARSTPTDDPRVRPTELRRHDPLEDDVMNPSVAGVVVVPQFGARPPEDFSQNHRSLIGRFDVICKALGTIGGGVSAERV
jgi:hypothetical protein